MKIISRAIFVMGFLVTAVPLSTVTSQAAMSQGVLHSAEGHDIRRDYAKLVDYDLPIVLSQFVKGTVKENIDLAGSPGAHFMSHRLVALCGLDNNALHSQFEAQTIAEVKPFTPAHRLTILRYVDFAIREMLSIPEMDWKDKLNGRKRSYDQLLEYIAGPLKELEKKQSE